MKCQILFSVKNKNKISSVVFFLSVELALREVKVNKLHSGIH